MRAFCTVSAPLEVCASSAEQLSPGSRFLALRLLGQQQPKTLYFLVDAKSRVREVYTQTCLHFATQGMQDTELFGLAVLIDGEYMFADPESKLSKYGPKSWRSSHTHGLDANGRPLLELHFRVQFYIESPFMLKDETSRHNYYLQLRHNVLQRELPRDHGDQAMFLLAGLALQADLGDAPSAGATSTTTPSTTSTAAASTTGTTNNQPKEKSNEEEEEEAMGEGAGALAAGRSRATAMTTTLPKIRKRLSSYNERMLRLSTYVTSTSQAAAKREHNASSSNANVVPVAAASSSDYFRLDDYLPPVLQTAWAKTALRACHREHQGLASAEAELLYIQQACNLHETINAHTFRMRLAKSEAGVGSAWFVIYAKGIKILGGAATEPATFLWPNITKLSFERKKFEIRSGESRITLYAASDEKNKLLLTLCKDTHQWSMKLAARLKEVSKREEEEAESHCLHASYACSRSLLLPYKSKNEQRISVISSTSSNTTSGIVSDRVHSEDELEIMINTPPAPLAAPSTESLALAHLLDRPSVSRQTSSVGQMSLKDLEEQLAALSVVNVRPSETLASCSAPSSSTTAAGNALISNSGSQRTNGSNTISVVSNANDSSTATDSPSSQHNIGSQCSSTCSTVVVTTPAPAVVHSTSSSLELGFSHTAQNSALSESNPDDFLPSSVRDETESVSGVSGVYTLAHGMAPPTETSGVYTMHSSELTGQSSELAESEKSSHYGIFQPAKGEASHTHSDSVDGNASSVKKCNEFRLRSDSNISTSSSFRGDGSDPTDNKHTLLSAEELTNLIVGRGTYPSRKTVSSTLHSDCDYVTLPLEVGGASVEELQPELPPAPPPYSARHEKTGLCGPPVVPPPPVPPMPKPVSVAPKPEPPALPAPPPVVPVAAPPPPPPTSLRRRDPPPYPTSLKPRPTSLISMASSAAPAPSAAGSLSSLKSEEVTARFITTRPQINILKAHTSLLPDGAKPSYAAPTHYSSAASSSGSVCSHQLSQQSLHNSNYAGGSQASLHHHHHAHGHGGHHAHHHRHSGSAAIGIPIVPYGLHHKSTASLHHQPQPPPQQACVLLPVIKPRQFLPPPPPSLPRQPPPPPPPSHPHLAGLYSSQLARNQLELYQQQMYSDVDYVIYPIQDPAVSQQEYLDAKQSSLLAAMAQAQAQAQAHSQVQSPGQAPHPYLAYSAGWDTCKGHAIYRSTPYLPLALSTHSRYASTQNLSDTYVQLPGAGYSPLYSPSMASLCSSYEPPPPPPLHPAALAAAAAANASSLFARSRSDDNILNSLDSLPMPKVKRLPPPPPPPYVNRLKKPPMPAPSEQPPPIPSKPVSHATLSMLPPRKPLTLNPHNANSPLIKTSSGAQWAGERPKPDLGLGLNRGNSNSILAQLQASVAASQAAAAQAANPLDIALLREKSKHLDLPLISALCNDRSLLKQTKVKVSSQAAAGGAVNTTTGSPNASNASNGSSSSSATGTGTTGTLNKAARNGGRTTAISHRHPQDKLPPLPVQLAEANNYVLDPAVVMKHHHKSYNSQMHSMHPHPNSQSQSQTQSQSQSQSQS
ncbi:protein expanded [Drosophila sulfurigaster albostrigata]|uniref:protein expanded n=1 Tax=Drosophila sulfurigaster albostrigata TaxID=89887 RepID=UPI002D218902|nr:protein expanded [Drosophila sulfurigaster albostrigata]